MTGPKITIKAEPVPACDWDNLKHDMCSCSECGWQGPVSSCTLEHDQDGWEMPVYHYHVCPVCELSGEHGMIDSYWNSMLEFFESVREENEVLSIMNLVDPDIHDDFKLEPSPDAGPEDQWLDIPEFLRKTPKRQMELLPGEPDRSKPPCLDCGALNGGEAAVKCICSGDRDTCHGDELWP